MPNRLRWEREAIEKRWPITSEQRRAMVALALTFAADQNASLRERRNAIKIILDMEKQNQSDEQSEETSTGTETEQQTVQIFKLPDNGRDSADG